MKVESYIRVPFFGKGRMKPLEELSIFFQKSKTLWDDAVDLGFVARIDDQDSHHGMNNMSQCTPMRERMTEEHLSSTDMEK